MTSFESGAFVWVLYPFVEEARVVRRPGLIITTKGLGPLASLGWVAMVTSALRPGWPGDIPIEAWHDSGLKIPSKVRTEKIATLDLSTAEPIGSASDALLFAVRQRVGSYLE